MSRTRTMIKVTNRTDGGQLRRLCCKMLVIVISVQNLNSFEPVFSLEGKGATETRRFGPHLCHKCSTSNST